MIGNLRAAVKDYLSTISEATLGQEHPISILLKTPLTTTQKSIIRTQAQQMVHEEHVKTFGPYSIQTMLQYWYWARLTGAHGHTEESLGMLERLRESWDMMYGANSSVAIIAVVEQARVMLAAGIASVKVECMLADALRRIDLLSADHSPQFQPIETGDRFLSRGLLFSRLAAHRVLGRVHILRSNFGAAIHSFEQAVAIAGVELDPESSVLQLCKADLDATRMLDLEQRMGVLSVEDPIMRLPSVYSILPIVPGET